MNNKNSKRISCSVCRRSFNARAALFRHIKDTNHKVGTPVKRPRKSISGAAARTSSGTDFITSVTISSKLSFGKILYQVPLNPLSFAGTRLSQEAALWNRWKPVNVTFMVKPSASTFVSGQYILAWTTDSAENFTDGSSAVVRLSSLKSITQPIHKSSSMRISNQTVQKWLYTDSREPSDSNHGKLIIALTGPLSSVTSDSSIVLNLYIKWSVTFDGPHIEGTTEISAIYAESDYASYFTTSTSEWADGKKLSLKTHEGGALVPFPNARPQTVYRIDSTAKLTYNTATAKGDIKYGVLIPNFSVKAFAVFNSLDSAKKFASTGDSTHCLDYASAGARVQPDNPAWYEQVGLTAIRRGDDVDALHSRISELEGLLEGFHLGQLELPEP